MLRCSRRPPIGAMRHAFRQLSRLAPPPPASVEPIIRVFNNVARLGELKPGPKPQQLLSLPPFPSSSTDPLPGRKKDGSGKPRRVTAISWVKHYFADMLSEVIQNHFNKGLVQVEISNHDSQTKENHLMGCLKQIKHNHVMEPGMKIHLPVSVAESKIIKRYDTIPTATLHPNADEIESIRRLVIYKDSAIIMLNKPPKVPMKGNLPVHSSMDVLAAAALSYGSDQGPKWVHRLDRESSGLLLMGKTKESFT